MKSRRAPSRSGFTMIELMIVIGIMAMIMAMGIPSVFSALKKDPIRQSVSDLLDACKEARTKAIVSGYPSEIVFQPLDYTFSVGSAAAERADEKGISTRAGSFETHAPPPAAAPSSGSHRFSDQIVLEMLSVNFQELKDEEFARVRFFPNGTCDEFTAVLHWPEKHAYRKITLDIISGVADVEVIR